MRIESRDHQADREVARWALAMALIEPPALPSASGGSADVIPRDWSADIDVKDSGEEQRRASDHVEGQREAKRVRIIVFDGEGVDTLVKSEESARQNLFSPGDALVARWCPRSRRGESPLYAVVNGSGRSSVDRWKVRETRPHLLQDWTGSTRLRKSRDALREKNSLISYWRGVKGSLGNSATLWPDKVHQWLHVASDRDCYERERSKRSEEHARSFIMFRDYEMKIWQ